MKRVLESERASERENCLFELAVREVNTSPTPFGPVDECSGLVTPDA